MNAAPRPVAVPVAPEERITLIDALRGSALIGLFLVHCVEHFELSFYPPHPPAWLQQLDGWTEWTAFFLFGGKAYAIFAMMFGVSFALILDRWTKRGINVTARFPWRLLLLGVFGYVNGILYSGDILLVLAVLGLPLVLIHRLPDRVLGVLAIALLLQIPSAWQAVYSLLHPDFIPAPPLHWRLFGTVREVSAHGSFADVVITNAGFGQTVRLWFTYETGRYTQMLGLFVVGLLLGRHHLLEQPGAAHRLARRLLVWGVVGFVVFFPLSRMLGHWGVGGMRGYVVGTWLGAYCNLAQMAIWVGAFILLYLHKGWQRWLDRCVPFGRMSLTCYVTQALVFVPFFYNYGLGLYRQLGQTTSVLCGLVFLVAQGAFAHWWMHRFYYGPLEWLWRAGTIRSLRTPFRRSAPLPAAREPACVA